MQKTWRSHLLLAYSLAILAFLYVPLVILAMYSFNDSRINAVWTGFTFRWYEQLFNNRRVLEALINTLIIGFASTIVSTTLGTIAAIALHRYKYKMQSVINGLVYLPILIPEIVMGLSLLVLFSQVQMPLGKGSLILAHITFCLSFVVITVGARLDGMRSDYEQAASDLYADFVISFFVAGPNSTTLPLYIYAMVKRGISPEINALSTLMMVVEIILVLLAEFLQPSHKVKAED